MNSVVYRPERADLLAASRLHHLAAITSRLVVVGTCVYALVFGALGFFVIRPLPAALFIGTIWAGMALGSIVIALALKHAIVPQYVVRRQLKEQRSMHEEYRLSWNEHGYVVRGPTASSNLPWSHYVRWRENAHVLLLYQSWQNYQFLPKRILSTEAADTIRGSLEAAGVAKAKTFFS